MSEKETSENESKKCIRAEDTYNIDDTEDTEDTFDKDTCFALFSDRAIDYFMKKNNLSSDKVLIDKVPTEKK